MRIVLLLIFAAILLTSCSKYQYYTLASDDVPKDQRQQFLIENDTCKINYNFSGLKGLITILVYNKTNKPLQVDWKRSSLIIGDSATSFFEPQITFSGEVERNRYAINQDVTGTITQPESIDFIPPQSAITKQNKFIRAKFVKVQEHQIGSRQKIKAFNFTKDKSPIAFRIYLTLISDNNSFNIDHSFYVTGIVQTHDSPQNFGVNTTESFFIREKTGFGHISTAVFGAGLIILLIAAL